MEVSCLSERYFNNMEMVKIQTLKSEFARDELYRFTNMCLTILYSRIPTYGLFTKNEEIPEDYWSTFSEDESEMIITHIYNNYVVPINLYWEGKNPQKYLKKIVKYLFN